MSHKLRTVTVAVLFGLIATAMAAIYLNSQKALIVESGAKRMAYLASADIPAGTSVAELLGKSMVVKVEMPKRYVADDAPATLEDLKDRLTVGPLSRGEQITQSKLRSASQSALAYKLAPGNIAVSIPVDDVIGVGGEIKPGDRVVIAASFSPGPGGSDMSKILLSGVEVIAVAGEAGRQGVGAAADAKKTITLSVTADQFEKLVFAEENGKVWVGLISGDNPPTDGRTMDTVFR